MKTIIDVIVIAYVIVSVIGFYRMLTDNEE